MSYQKKKTLTSEEWRRISEIYEKVVSLPVSKRREFLREQGQACPKIEEEVSFLLRATRKLDSFLEDGLAEKLADSFSVPVFSHGDQIEQFRIEEILGRGAFATVYLAKDLLLEREVALKVSPNRGGEAKTMAQIEHDHIVKVYSESTLVERNLRLVCMQYVAGATLEQIMLEKFRLKEGIPSGAEILVILDSLVQKPASFDAAALGDRESFSAMGWLEIALWIGSKLSEALSLAHAKGILHLDVKPSNILISQYGRPFLTDFNIALNVSRPATFQVDSFGGTFHYMAPEHEAVFSSDDKEAAISKIDRRADIFSLGCVVRGFIDKLREGKEISILPIEIEAVLQKAQEICPENRHASAIELGKELEACRELVSIRKTLQATNSISLWVDRHPILTLSLAGAFPQLTAGVIGICYNSVQILSHLSPAQMKAFDDLNIFYNPVVYLLVFPLWLFPIFPLMRFLKSPHTLARVPGTVDNLRKHALWLPLWGCCISTLGWIPSSIIYPLWIHTQAGALSLNIVIHFLLSFSLSWLIALSYSFLCHEYIVVGAIYPKLWLGCTDVRRRASSELSKLSSRSRFFYRLVVLIPLLGAVLLLFAGSTPLDSPHGMSFRVLVSLLIGLGVFGVFFASNVSNGINHSVLAFIKK